MECSARFNVVIISTGHTGNNAATPGPLQTLTTQNTYKPSDPANSLRCILMLLSRSRRGICPQFQLRYMQAVAATPGNTAV